MEIAALVCGIASLGCSLGLGTKGWIGCICAVVAIVLGAISIKKNLPKKTLGKVGMILGIVSLVLGIIVTVACYACVGAVASGLNDLVNSLQ